MRVTFKDAYKNLNKAQKEAVDTIDGPVMVVAGPGTGKTQVLALRIANILEKTDTKGDAILCLTFTNSGVRAMRERLEQYIGRAAHSVVISTFHSFAIRLVEKHYLLLDFLQMPSLLSDDEAVLLIDEMLHTNDWEHIRPRTNPSMYFADLKQFISLLKRERVSAQAFLAEVEKDIKNLETDPENISTRGESKGKLKKEIEKKIESLERTREVVEFYRLYEEKKRELARMDYDDVLEYAVVLAETYEDVRADIRENYLYVLVDEHQDSSGVQNRFLKAVWQDTDKPNIFVVGDDRQLIYGFSGASLSLFEEFAHMFGNAHVIALTDNYRSSAPILSVADELLQSSMTKGKLVSNIKDREDTENITLSQYAYPRDEIIAAALYFKKKIEEGLFASECALLVPRNYHVREALDIFSSLGVSTSSDEGISLFRRRETEVFRRVLGILANPYNSTLIATSLLDRESNIPALGAHAFLRQTKADKITIDELIAYGRNDTLFSGENPIATWGKVLRDLVNNFSYVSNVSGGKLSFIMSEVGTRLFINTLVDAHDLAARVEVVRSFIHVAMLYEQRNTKPTLASFLEYLDRLETYGTYVDLATFEESRGVRIMTLHKSKGLEYTAVWVAHMNEEILMSEKKNGFTLPEKIKEHIHERDIEMAKRELYVAITRAKLSCTLSYASTDYNGKDLECASILRDLESIHITKKDQSQTEKELLAYGPTVYTPLSQPKDAYTVKDLQELVTDNYADTKVSVTLLNNFFECPWKWYFRNFLRLPEVKSASLALGSAVHTTIEYILKSTKLPSQKYFKKDINEKIISQLQYEGIENESELKKLSRDGLHAVLHWVESYYKNLAADFRSERSLSFRDPQFPHLLMYGKIDLTERASGGAITVTDFKTGAPKTANAIEKVDDYGRMNPLLRQLAMYSYLVAGSEKGAQVHTSRLLFLEALVNDKNASYVTHIDNEQIDLLVRDIKEYDDAIKDGSWVTRQCNFQPYGSDRSGCPYCKLAEVFKIENKLEKRA